MTTFRRLRALIVFGCAALLVEAQAAPGKLVIVGGALNSDTEAIYRAFIDNRPAGKANIAIIPAASGKPARNALRFKRDLVHYGVSADKIHVLPIAVRDDSTTEDTDESQWQQNAHSEELAAAVDQFGAFWFLGGDQMRIVDALLPEADRPTAVLAAIREQHELGAVIGGTSAGAAMMSSPMIAAGDSFSSLTVEPAEHYAGIETQEKGQLYLHHGLGFFPHGITDQHFDRRARLGRLVRALAETGRDFGFAVDEDTGMLVDLDKHRITAIGSGNVTIVDASGASFERSPFTARNVLISIMAAGDRYSLPDLAVENPSGDATIGNEYFSSKSFDGAGIALGNPRLDQLLGGELMDNSRNTAIRRYNFVEDNSGFMYTFSKTENSRGYWSDGGGSLDRYTLENIRLDITPVEINVSSED